MEDRLGHGGEKDGLRLLWGLHAPLPQRDRRSAPAGASTAAAAGTCGGSIGVTFPNALLPQWVYARRDDVFALECGVDLAPFNTRSWVMQERLLSRGILHFAADMLHWECGLRSASELGPHGYTYKVSPEHFKDNYMPELKSYVLAWDEMQEAEHAGRGLSWETREQVRRRPVSVMIDPDAPPGSQALWQQKRGFCKTSSSRMMSYGQRTMQVGTRRIREAPAEGRASARRSRSCAPEVMVRPRSQSRWAKKSPRQVWYDVVEPYSRRTLKKATDKLMALRGIENEVARARKWTYLCGL